MTIDEICDLLAKELPPDYTVTITLENGCGSVDVEQWREEAYEIGEFEDGSIENRLLEALKACKEHAGLKPCRYALMTVPGDDYPLKIIDVESGHVAAQYLGTSRSSAIAKLDELNR